MDDATTIVNLMDYEINFEFLEFSRNFNIIS